MIVLPRIFFCALIVIKVTSAYEERGRKTENKCKEYVKYACDNQPPLTTSEIISSPTDRIKYGKEVPLGVFPHMAAIYLFDKLYNGTNGSGQCSGTLISENFVLSAAHCAEDSARFEGIFGTVKLGSTIKFDDGAGIWYNVIEMYRHPNYTFEPKLKLRNDVLLLRLDREVQFSPYIRPICLRTKPLNGVSNAVVSGWGKDESGNISDILKSTQLYIDNEIVKSNCNEALEDGFFDSTTVICAGDPNQTTGTDQGDSGGPMQISLDTGCPNTYEQIGIVSGSSTFNDTHPRVEVYLSTDIEQFIPWIESNVWPD
ncbi:venom protease-like [Planococcus citri]|uniref:venom protease-like n=1 Tax=Planococcus citri TaxID=170843 RepID=UPI0031F74C75